jgi:hypothetical protein
MGRTRFHNCRSKWKSGLKQNKMGRTFPSGPGFSFCVPGMKAAGTLPFLFDLDVVSGEKFAPSVRHKHARGVGTHAYDNSLA